MFRKSVEVYFLSAILIGIIGAFSPAASSTDDFILSRNITGGYLSNPEGIAVDSAGTIWVTNYSDNSVTKLNFSGKPLSPATSFTGGGLNRPLGIAIDSEGNVWVANYGNNSVSKLDSMGKLLSPATGFTGGGLNRPLGIAIDSEGNVWVANYGNNSGSQLDPSGKPIPPATGFTVSGFKHPFGIAIDGAGNVSVANEGISITELIGAASPAEGGGAFSGSPFGALINKGEKTMETLNVFGAEMLPNELGLLKIIVGVGFIGWMLLFLVQAVWMANAPGEEIGLDEYGCHYDKKTETYYCVTGPFAGRGFSSKQEMLRLAA